MNYGPINFRYPGFVIEEELYPGALSIESLKQLVAKARGR